LFLIFFLTGGERKGIPRSLREEWPARSFDDVREKSSTRVTFRKKRFSHYSKKGKIPPPQNGGVNKNKSGKDKGNV